MKLAKILTEKNNILDATVNYTLDNFTRFKHYITRKFKEQDSQETPPFFSEIVEDIEYGTAHVGGFSKDNLIYKYYVDDLKMFYDTDYISHQEARRFSTMKSA